MAFYCHLMDKCWDVISGVQDPKSLHLVHMATSTTSLMDKEGFITVHCVIKETMRSVGESICV